jgi:hypothetical protein
MQQGDSLKEAVDMESSGRNFKRKKKGGHHHRMHNNGKPMPYTEEGNS